MIQARLADGRILEFPDGTPPSVVQATVKRMVGAPQKAPTLAPPLISPLSESVADSFFANTLPALGEKRAEAARTAESGDIGYRPFHAQPPTPESSPSRAGFDEEGFRRWYAERAGRLGLNPDPDDPRHGYDYRSAYSAGAEPDAATGHWPSEFKADDHPNRYVGILDTKTGLPRSIPGAEPGLGHEDFTDVAEPGAWPDYSKQGISQRSLRDTVLDRGFGWAIGAAERSPEWLQRAVLGFEVPEGTRAALRENQQEGFDRYLAAHPEGGLGRAVGLAVGDVGASMAGPQALLGPGAGAVAGRGAAVLGAGPGLRTLAGLAGGAIEGAGQSALDTIDLPPEERGRMIAMGAGLGGLAAVRGVAAEARHAAAPKPPPPEVRQQLLTAFDLDKSLVAERAAAAGDPKVQAKAVGEIEAKWQPEFAKAGAAGDQVLGQMADRLQGHVAPEVKAPPPAESAFQLRDGRVIRTGPFHNLDALPEGVGVEHIATSGFMQGDQYVARESMVPGVGDLHSNPNIMARMERQRAPVTGTAATEAAAASGAEPDPLALLNRRFPPARSQVDGRAVREEIPNVGSLDSSLDSYEVLPGVREIKMGEFDPEYQPKPYSVSEQSRLGQLIGDIRESKEISPLIVVYDGEKHPYILEGGHRFDALKTMNAESFPALVVIDTGRTSLEDLAAQRAATSTSQANMFGPGEAGFLRLGRNKPPAPPPSPIEAVMPRNEPTPSPAGPLGRLQAAADRVTDLWFNREDAPVRRMRRAGLKREADYLEQMQARARGAGGMQDPQRQAGPVYEGTYVFDPDLHGPGKFGSRRTGDGLQVIVGGMDDQALYDLDGLLAARRQVELERRAALGDPIQIDPRGTAIAQQTLADLEARYGTEAHPVTGAPQIRQLDALAERFRDWTVRAWMIPLKEAGRFSDAEFTYQQQPDGSFTYGGDIIAKNDLYAPFQRLMEVLGDEDVYGLAPVTSGKPNPIHAITGGLSPDTPIARPIESAVELAQKATLWVERQRVRNLFGDAVDSSPELQLEIRKLSPQGGAGKGPKTGLPIHVRGDFPVWRDGVRTDYTAPPDVLRAVESLTPSQANPVMEAAKLAARMLRAGATITLEFPFRNLGRDVQDAAVYGPGYNPALKIMVDPFAGLLDVVGQGRWSKEWRANGGALSGATAVGRPQIEASLRDITGQRGRIARRYETEIGGQFGEKMRQGPASAATTLIKTGLFPFMAPMEALAENLESATKVGAYRRMRLRGMGAGEAAAISRDVSSPDFGRAGSAGQVWNQVEAFSNAELQDLYRLGRAFRRAPGTTTIKALAFLTLPAMANWYKNKDDPQYQALPEWERIAFYHPVKLGAGRWVRIPRPLGLINLAWSYGPQKLLEKMAGEDPDAIEELGRALVQQTPLHYLPQMENLRGGGRVDWVPSVAQPLVEAAAGPAGWSSFREAPIDTTAVFPDAAPLPEDRVRDQTSGIARAAGKALNASPIKIDYLLQGYGAFWGRTLAQGTGPAARAFGADPTQDTLMGRMAQGGSPQLPTTAADIPGVRGFVSSPAIGFGSDPVTKFYQLATEAAQAKKSMKDAMDARDVNRYLTLLREHPEASLADALYADRKHLSELRKQRNEILANAALSPEQRENMLISIDQLVAGYAGVRLHGYSDILHNMREGK